ncbi:solute carrier family 43 member 3 [Folsomia candida]|uniref:Large neutral amino acids transporter small subunit 4 n=1 Tax=Folsomia candida TaxID=158441 RepID=A0A226DBA1_FOLCA|nr:solute carrier family 43 member 3 [Folsomia candida]OXA42188.1 Large neutral amino acids transporter small subunit 4 [Folsomia candida]
MHLWKRIVFIGIGFFESLTVTGIIFGWPALVHVFQLEGIFSHFCLEDAKSQGEYNTNGTEFANTSDTNSSIIIRCPRQDNMFGLLYSLMIAMYGIPSALVGFSLDYAGLRFTRVTSGAMMIGGFIWVGLATAANPWMVWPGMLLISFGSNGMRLSSLQCGNAWPAKRSTIMFCYTSAHAASTLVFLMFQYANAAGISLRSTSFVMSAVCGITLISSFILPKMKVEYQPKLSLGNNEVNDADNNSIPLNKINTDTEESKGNQSPSGKEPDVKIPLGLSIKTMSFVFHNVWLVNIYMTRFYVTSFNTWAWKTTDDPNQIAFYNSFSGICLIISPFINPIGGLITDFMTKRADKKNDPIERLAAKFRAPAFVLTLASALTLAVYICKISYSPNAVYVSIVLISIVRPISIASLYSYVQLRFYPEHFNRLTGISYTIISIVGLLQYPQYLWLFKSEESYLWASYTFCFMILLTFISPGHLLVTSLTRKFAAKEIRNRK